MEFANERVKLSENSNVGKLALGVGAAGLIISLIGYFTGGDEGTKQFYYSYLTAFVFWCSIGLGGLFFTMMNHMTTSVWSVVFRRIGEAAMAVLPVLFVLFLPVLFGIDKIFKWSDEAIVATDHLIHGKVGYLNTTFFVIRSIGYFALWSFLGYTLYKASIQQDSADSPALRAKMKKISAPGILIFALSITFASFDWMMSLDPHWYSTIFGVYFFSGMVLGVLAFMLRIALHMRKKGVLADTISIEHYQDIGKLLFAFTVFWAYIAFSQYFLIWYANIPEETIWFIHRWEGAWKQVSLVIIFGHFALPFLILLTRAAKRNLKVLSIMSIWYLVVHYVDVYWLIMPNLHTHGAHFHWLDLTTLAGVGGIFVYFFWNKFVGNELVPVNEPDLNASIHFTNV